MVEIKDLPQTYRMLAQLIGLEHVLILGKELGGMSLYFPKLDETLSKIRDKEIVAEFNGVNYTELARKHHISDRWVREIIKKDQAQKRRLRRS